MRRLLTFILFVFTCVSTIGQNEKGLTGDIESNWYVDYRIGLTSNFLPLKTRNYLDNYFNLGFGASIYYKNFVISYCVNPTTLLRFKRPFETPEGDSIRPYANTYWKTNGSYFVNLIRHNIDLGYELKINRKLSVIPSIGIGIGHFTVRDSANYKKKVNLFYDLSLGCSLRRYVYESKGSGIFYGLQGYVGYSNITGSFSPIGHPYWSVTINCGVKFVPQGLILFGLLNGYTHSHQHPRSKIRIFS